MAKKLNLDNTEYTKHDVLVLELDVVPATLITEFGAVKGGKTRLEVLGEAIPFIEKYVADEEELETMKSLQQGFNVRKRKTFQKLQEDFEANKINEDEKIEKETDFYRRNNPIVEFVKLEGRDPKPIKSIKVIENKGPRPTDLQAKDDRDKELMATMIEFMKQNSTMIQEMMKQNKKS